MAGVLTLAERATGADYDYGGLPPISSRRRIKTRLNLPAVGMFAAILPMPRKLFQNYRPIIQLIRQYHLLLRLIRRRPCLTLSVPEPEWGTRSTIGS